MEIFDNSIIAWKCLQEYIIREDDSLNIITGQEKSLECRN
jgi:hypothetical protein